MLSSNPLILETLALLLRHGVRHMVLCPGSRNAAIVHTVCRIPDFRTHTATDERCAGFMAIGLADATGEPVAVVVTSGSALANLHPAACEAYYRQVPVVFISADRPAAWIGQMDGQTMPQAGALGEMVRMCVSLPEGDLWHANRLLNEALLCCTARSPRGPVHINLPVAEPIYDFSAERLPEARQIRLCRDLTECFTPPETRVRAVSHPQDEDTVMADHWRVLIVCGQLRPGEVPADEMRRLWTLHSPHIIAENLSNLPLCSYANADRIDWSRMMPVDRLITVGGHIVSKELKQHFRTHRPLEHWHVSEDGAVADLFGCQTVAVQARARDFLLGMMEHCHEQIAPPYPPARSGWTKDVRIELLQEFFRLLPEDAALHLANSSSVRLAQLALERWYFSPWAKLSSVPTILCNRGINGIEGSLSTAVGYALARPERPVFVLIGDLSFFYDRNALWTSPLPRNLHILLLNDGGGSIFHTLPLPTEPEASRRAIMGTHTLSARHTALQHGLAYFHGQEELEPFVQSSETSLLEITYDETMENR